MPAVVRVDGIRDLARDLRAVSRELPRELRTAGLEGAEIVAIAARARAPRLTNALADSVRAGATQRIAYVRAGNQRVPYAGPIHFGWPAHHIRPQPFIYEAVDERADKVFTLYVRRIDALVTRHHL